jgi:hypothetical protein
MVYNIDIQDEIAELRAFKEAGFQDLNLGNPSEDSFRS